MVVRHNRANVTYGYILVNTIYNTFKVFSDVFVLWGTCRVLVRYKYLRSNTIFRATTVVASLFWFLALYHLILLFVLSFAWLSFSDLNVINAIAEARSGFEVAFTALQFCSTIAMSVWAVYKLGSVRLNINSVSLFYSEEREFSIAASIALLLRSFCEVVIVGQLDRWPANTQEIFRARDVTYGLFSMFFVGFITFAIPKNAEEDPLIKRQEEQDRADEAAKEAALEEVATWIIQKLGEVTEHGRKTSPTIPTLLDTLESELGPQRPHQDLYNVWDTKKKEIHKLRELYADWEPIYKWQGEGTTTDPSRDAE
ncbi:hypothetical protein FGG08_005911 [Glutinoglossum americanum]|uniref:Uncharacterized protein n=1 Tax=Glutinoglossum americanum TaxID=1670608 RepID=A0A9P8L0Z0_9PEZI|nr:hypothetical protein FGG08_005911 [Glutinoglossum americanum]